MKTFLSTLVARVSGRPGPQLVVGGVMAAALLSGYVHVLHRAVAEAPERQRAAFAAGATHDVEAEREGPTAGGGGAHASTAGPRPATLRTTRRDDDGDPTRNRLFDAFTLPHSAAVAAAL